MALHSQDVFVLAWKSRWFQHH